MLTLYCDWDDCDFQTPPLNREHYQAMVAHLQVINDIIGKSLFFARILFELVLPEPPEPGASLPSPFAANLNHSGFDVGHLDHASSNTRFVFL